MEFEATRSSGPHKNATSSNAEIISILRHQQLEIEDLKSRLVESNLNKTIESIEGVHSKLTPEGSFKCRDEAKEGRAELSFLLKNMPKFAGTSSEDFESWESTVKMLLNDSFLPRERKVFTLIINVQGEAKKAISMDKVNSVESILEDLRKVFGHQPRKIVQKPGELVRLYFTRLTNATLLCKKDVSNEERQDILLELFIEGLLPQYMELLKQLTPDNLNIAVRAVEKWEWQANLTRESRKNKRDSKDELCELDEDSLLQEPVKKQKKTAPMIERINALEKIVQNLNSNRRAENPKVNQSHDSRTSKTMEPRYFPRPIGSCYACRRPGHRYLQCRAASDLQKQEIKEKL